MSPMPRDDEFSAPPTAQDIALAILLETESLSQLMELHYYAGEPGFLDTARVIAALPEAERAALCAFLEGGERMRVWRDGVRLIIEPAEG
jgi:hypothetical protein